MELNFLKLTLLVDPLLLHISDLKLKLVNLLVLLAQDNKELVDLLLQILIVLGAAVQRLIVEGEDLAHVLFT